MNRRLFIGSLAATVRAQGVRKISVLLIDGQNNHRWQLTTPVLQRMFDQSGDQSGLFTVTIATSPPKGADMSSFRPDFAAYSVVVSNYNGEAWPETTRMAFEKYVRGGGGFVTVHAADNAFPEWTEYNRMIALGGWGGRTEKHGPYARFRDGKLTLDPKPGPGGHHGKRHAFTVTTRDRNHPITRGLPETWTHATDELYDSLRGPAQNITLLATAFSDPSTGGTGEHEPTLFTVKYGKGRVFHTTLGHDIEAMNCIGFAVTLLRGTEWAATGKVTQKVPVNFPK